MTDPLANFLRAERERLIAAAPAPDAARLWHLARARRAEALRRAMRAAGWLVRLAVAGAVLVCLLAWRPEAWFLGLIAALAIWLTRGACARLHPQAPKGMTT